MLVLKMFKKEDAPNLHAPSIIQTNIHGHGDTFKRHRHTNIWQL